MEKSRNFNSVSELVAGLDAAVYSAAKNYLMEKQGGGGGSNTSWKERFRSGKGPPIDPSQWKYCELCKCTCAGELVNNSPCLFLCLLLFTLSLPAYHYRLEKLTQRDKQFLVEIFYAILLKS